MGDEATISVIIPTWNRADTLEMAIRSTLIQAVLFLEVLVCDDGSTDGSEEIVRSIGDSRVRWIPGNHAGRPAVPRNRGIREARGEWLAFLDSDDEWLPGKLERQLELARAGYLFVCSNAVRKVPGVGMAGILLTEVPPVITFHDLLRVNWVVCSSVIAKRSLVLRASGFPEAVEIAGGTDYALWLRIATLTDIGCVTEPLLVYSDDPATSMRREDPESHILRGRVFSDFLAWAEESGVSRNLLAEVRRQAAGEAKAACGEGILLRLLKPLIRLFRERRDA